MPASCPPTYAAASPEHDDAGRLGGLSVPDDQPAPDSPRNSDDLAAIDDPRDATTEGDLRLLGLSRVGDLSALRSLDLQGQRLRSLPPALYRLSALEELNLNHNELARLDAAVSDLANLRELLLAGNRLRRLPQSVGRLRKLAVLDVSGNLLAFLPAEVAALRSLRRLWCDSNRFGAAPLGGGCCVGDVRELGESERELSRGCCSSSSPVASARGAAAAAAAATGGDEIFASGRAEQRRSPDDDDDDDLAPRRRESILRLGDIAIQAAGLAIARDEHSYCSRGVQRCKRPALAAAATPRDGLLRRHRSPEENRCFQVAGPSDRETGPDTRQPRSSPEDEEEEDRRVPRAAAAGSPDRRETDPGETMCRLDLVPPSLRPLLRRSRAAAAAPSSCSLCRRPVYHGGIFSSGMLVKCDKVVSVLYVLCSYRCRAASRRP